MKYNSGKPRSISRGDGNEETKAKIKTEAMKDDERKLFRRGNNFFPPISIFFENNSIGE
jgi:hypothetical protein